MSDPDSTTCGCAKADGHADTELSSGSANFVSEFHVPKMDCPSEAGMIRMALEPVQPAVTLEFDIPERKVRVFHDGKPEDIGARLTPLGLGAKLTYTRSVSEADLAEAQNTATQKDAAERKVLWTLLIINGVMFVLELGVGWWAQSIGLIADSLDMLADAAVYGVALYAVGHSLRMKIRAAHFSGWLQVLLALGALSEVIRRFIVGSEPTSGLMMGFGLVALIANVTCLLLISKNRNDGAHMKASWIFSANDVIANTGVILAGALVAWTGSRYPDLVIGFMIALVVLNGARRILQIKS